MSNYFTPEGLEKLKKELERLKKKERREIADRLKHAAAFGDLSENAAYHEAKEAQAFLEGRILELEYRVNNAVLVQKGSTDSVQVGSTVLLQSKSSQETFTITGSMEANPLEGKISGDSPLGKSLLNRKVGDRFEFQTLEGKVTYKVIKIT